MKDKLILTIDKKVFDKAEVYAKSIGTTAAKMAEEYLASLAAEIERKKNLER